MRILFVVPYPPSLVRVRPYNLVRHLSRQGHEVTVATLWTTAQERADVEALRAHCHAVIAVELPRARSLWNCARAVPSSTPFQARYCWQPALATALRRAVAETTFDVIHVEHLRGAAYGLWLQQVAPRVPVVWDSVDCISHLFEQAAQESRSLKGRWITRLELARTRRYEGWLAQQFDRVLVTSAIDQAALLQLAEAYPVRTGITGHARETAPSAVKVVGLPNGVDLDYFQPAPAPRAPATLVLSGKMSYHANVTAALHLVEDVMPLVWAQAAGVRVQIVGKDPTPPIRALAEQHPARVEVTGTVPDIRPYLQRATLAVVPIPYGAGIQNKVLEAMACGTPVVATPQATAALASRAGRDLVVAETGVGFARAVLALLGDPDRRATIGEAGRRFVEQHHSWQAMVARLERQYRATIEARAGQRVQQLVTR